MSFFARLGVVFGVAVYTYAFNISYSALVTDTYSYLGYGYHPLHWATLFITYALCLVPAFWIPTIKRPSILLFLSQYLLIYIPASFILHYSSLPAFDDARALELQAAMLLGLSIMQTAYYLPLLRMKPSPLSARSFAAILTGLVVVPLGYMLITQGRTFRLTDFSTDNTTFRYEQIDVASAHALRFIGVYR